MPADVSAAIRSGGILAAGCGSRLKRDGCTISKPLVPVAGVPLVEHVLANFAAAGVTSVAIIFNGEEEECARFVRERFPDLELDIVVRTTASSFESYRAIAPLLAPGRALVSTVDAWCPRADFLAFVQAAAGAPDGETVLAVTPFVQDERPLWASVDASGRVTRLGGPSGDAVTAGIYAFPDRVRALSLPPGLGRLRDFLGWLVESGEPVRAISIPKVIDIDRAEDVAAAEEMAEEPGRGTRDTGRAGTIRPSSEFRVPSPATGERRTFSKTGAARCWGVYRELAHSPGRENDDAEILRATARQLADRGFEVGLKSPGELPETDDAAGIPPFLFVMCEREGIVRRLCAWERQGVQIVNRPQAIRNTDRELAIARFAGDGVPFPASALVATTAPAGETGVSFPCWVKRGDVHATQAADVSFAAEPEELAARLSALASRGITRAVLQEHIAGDLLKFYGVAGGDEQGGPLSWFQWFYHRDQKLWNHSFDPVELRSAVARAAAALGLDVFGGDAIATAEGRIILIDVNAWPSFALYRETAAEKIASHLAARFRQARVAQWPRS